MTNWGYFEYRAIWKYLLSDENFGLELKNVYWYPKIDWWNDRLVDECID